MMIGLLGGFGWIKLIPWGLAAMLGAGIYFQGKQKDAILLELGEVKVKYEQSIADHTETIATLETLRMNAINQARRIQDDYNDLLGDYNRSKEEISALEKLLAKHNLTNLAHKKPGLIRNRANSATVRLFNNLEKATGTSKINP